MSSASSVCFLLLLPAMAAGLVVESRVDLPYPWKSDGQTAVKPRLVRALYEVVFQPTHSSCSPGQACLRFEPTKDPTIIKVEEFVDNLIKKSEEEVPVVKGFDPGLVQSLLESERTSVSEQAHRKVPVVSKTPQASQDVPIFRGTIDTDAVLRKEPRLDRRHPQTTCFRGRCWTHA